MAVAPFKLVGSEFKGTRVLVIDPDEKRGQQNEVRTEIEKDLQRIDVYFVSSLEAGRDAVRKYNCNLAIFPDGLGQSDFVNSQVELKHASPDIQMIILTDNPSLSQLRSSKKIGSVYDFAPLSTLNNFETICSLIVNFTRDSEFRVQSQVESLEFTKTLQKCLLIQDKKWLNIKNISKRLTDSLVLDFDFSDSEVGRILAAEQIFLPWLGANDYRTILGGDQYGLFETLVHAGVWGDKTKQATSSDGFVITFSNWLAQMIVAKTSINEIYKQVQARPIHIKHPSIQLITKEKLEVLCDQPLKLVKHG